MKNQFEKYKVSTADTLPTGPELERIVRKSVDQAMPELLETMKEFMAMMEKFTDFVERRTAEKQFKSSLAGQTNSFVNWLAPTGQTTKAVRPDNGTHQDFTSWLSRGGA